MTFNVGDEIIITQFDLNYDDVPDEEAEEMREIIKSKQVFTITKKAGHDLHNRYPYTINYKGEGEYISQLASKEMMLAKVNNWKKRLCNTT
jgi:hypothetical protein